MVLVSSRNCFASAAGACPALLTTPLAAALCCYCAASLGDVIWRPFHLLPLWYWGKLPALQQKCCRCLLVNRRELTFLSACSWKEKTRPMPGLGLANGAACFKETCCWLGVPGGQAVRPRASVSQASFLLCAGLLWGRTNPVVLAALSTVPQGLVGIQAPMCCC